MPKYQPGRQLFGSDEAPSPYALEIEGVWWGPNITHYKFQSCKRGSSYHEDFHTRSGSDVFCFFVVSGERIVAMVTV
jgi:hypothetical protein